MLRRIQAFLRNSAVIIIFSILLPTADVFTDLRLIFFLYFWAPEKYVRKNNGTKCYSYDNFCEPGGWRSHWKFATALLIPFLLNYVLSWLAWARLEKNKLRTFLWPALNLYPQYRAARLVKLFWSHPDRTKEEKIKFEREISLTEVFLESVPTTLVMTAIIIVLVRQNTDADWRSIIGPNGSTDYTLFFISYGISVFSASFGLARCLKIGVCRTMGEGGPLGGLLGGRFLLAMLASTVILVCKGYLIVLALLVSLISFWPCSPWWTLGPGILSRLPSLFLLPIFTCFTFSRINFGRCGQANRRVRFSKKMTGVNMVLTLAGIVGRGSLKP